MEKILLLLIGGMTVLALYKIKYHYFLRIKYLKGISKEEQKLAEKQKKFKNLIKKLKIFHLKNKEKKIYE